MIGRRVGTTVGPSPNGTSRGMAAAMQGGDRFLTSFVIAILVFPSLADSNSEYGDIIRQTPEYEKITTPRPDKGHDDDDRHHHRHYHHYHRYDHGVYIPDYPQPTGYARSERSRRYVRTGDIYVGVTVGRSEFDYDDIDQGDASIVRIGYRPYGSRLGYELSFFDSGDAEVTSLDDIDLQVETINLALSVNSGRVFRSRVNLFGQGGIYFADTTLSGPFDRVSEDSNGFLLAAGVEVMLNRNFSIKAEAYNLFDVEDFADDESITIVNLGGQFVF